MSSLPRGLYEELLTKTLQRRLDALSWAEATTGQVDPADQPHVLARHVEQAVRGVLAATADPARCLTIVHDLLATLDQHDDAVSEPARRLHAIRQPPGPGVVQIEPVRPATPVGGGASH